MYPLSDELRAPTSWNEVAVSGRQLLILTEPLGGSALARLAQTGNPAGRWYPERPRSRSAWKAYIDALRDSARGWPELLRAACTPNGTAAERLENAAARDGVVLTTGQQPGLFGGPIYTWAKAVSAIACADVLEELTGVPVVPVFWAATDDSDFLEASWTIVASGGRVTRLALPNKPPDGTRLADVPLEDTGELLEALAQACGSSADRRAMELVARSYVPGTTFGSAYVKLLRGLLEPMGMVVLDAANPEVSRAADSILRRALEQHGAVSSALMERDREIRAAGYTPQVAFDPARTLVFEVQGGRRRRIAAASVEDALRNLPPGTLSPNVLLRPVVERWLLPTAAYAAGPGELAYFAQASAVARALGLALPVALPRWSTTLVEPEVAKILEKYGLEVSDLAHRTQVETRLAKAAWPSSLTESLARLRHAVADGVADVAEQVSIHGLLAGTAAAEALERWMLWRIDRFERRVNAAVKKREEQLMHDIAVAAASLFPAGIRQERALNIVPLLARFGLEVLAHMRREAEHHAHATLVPGSVAVA